MLYLPSDGSWQKQTLLTGGVLDSVSLSDAKGKGRAPMQEDTDAAAIDDEDSAPATSLVTAQKSKPTYSKDKIRVSQADRTLDSMFPVLDPATQPLPTVELIGSGVNAINDERSKYRASDSVGRKRKRPEEDSAVTQASPSALGKQFIEESECFLTSMVTLRKKASEGRHEGLLFPSTIHYAYKALNPFLCRPDGNNPKARICGHR